MGDGADEAGAGHTALESGATVDAAAHAVDAVALTRAVARGDRGAFEALYRGWFAKVYAGARAATGRDEAFCMDVVHDVMVRVVKAMKPLKGERELRAWLGRATISCAIDRLRREERAARRERAVAVGVEGGGARDGGAAEQIEWLNGELARLGVEERALLAQRFGRGRTIAEAGRDGGMTGGSAHGKLRRLIRSLRRGAMEVFL